MNYYQIAIEAGDRIDVCELCGSMVDDNKQHDLWHDILAGTAKKAESAYSLHYPIGFRGLAE